MVIHCPLSPALFGHLDSLVRDGADEFYLGYEGRFKDGETITSRRQSGKGIRTPRCALARRLAWLERTRAGHSPNFPGLPAAIEAVAAVRRHGKNAFLTFNEHFYPPDAMATILDDIGGLLSAGARGVVACDINLITAIRERYRGCYIIAGTGARVTNASAAAVYRTLGVDRVVFPRHLSTAEVVSITSQADGLEFEVFIKNQRCFHVDGVCAYAHGKLGGIEFDRGCTRLRLDPPHADVCKPRVLACGVCDLHQLGGVRGIALKIVGRELPIDLIGRDVVFLKRALGFLDKRPSERAFRNKCRRLHAALYKRPCRDNCYRGY